MLSTKNIVTELFNHFDNISYDGKGITCTGTPDKWSTFCKSDAIFDTETLMRYMLRQKLFSYPSDEFSSISNIGSQSFAKEHQTVRFNNGRRQGKSTAIKSLANPQHVIIVNSFEQQNQFSFGFDMCPVYGPYSMIHARGQTYSVVWIDDASSMPKESIDEIYNIFWRNPNQIFFLVG